MPARLLVLCFAVSACAPALTIRRLSRPQAALGTARTVYVQVTPAPVDTVAGEPERVSETMRRRLSERLTGIGYAVCPQLPCGDGVLEVVLEDVAAGADNTMPHLPDFAMMEAAVNAVHGRASNSTTSAAQVNARLGVRIRLQQPDGKVGFRRSFSQLTSRQAPAGEVMKEAVDSVVKDFGDLLTRQAPLTMVTLEVGGPLNHGVELLHAADWAGAVTYFTELTRTKPELDGAWYDLGFALEAQGHWAAALEAYRAAAQRAKKPHYERAVSTAQAVLFVPG